MIRPFEDCKCKSCNKDKYVQLKEKLKFKMENNLIEKVFAKIPWREGEKRKISSKVLSKYM